MSTNQQSETERACWRCQSDRLLEQAEADAARIKAEEAEKARLAAEAEAAEAEKKALLARQKAERDRKYAARKARR